MLATVVRDPEGWPGEAYVKCDALAWVEAFRNLRGNPFRFDARGRRAYIHEVYNSHAHDVDITKARQVEVSEFLLNTGLRFCDLVPYVNWMHLFPTGPMANRFSRERLEMAIADSPRLKAKMKQIDGDATERVENVLLKKLGTSFYSMASSFSEYGGRGPSCDGIGFDEYDKQNPKIEGVFAHSLAHSEWALRRRISTPTAPEYGIHKRFLLGSMSIWHYKCVCGLDQEMIFPKNILEIPPGKDPRYFGAIMGDKYYFGCQRCARPVNREVRLDKTDGQFGGHWVHGRPEKVGVHDTFHITWFMAPWKRAEDIMREYLAPDMFPSVFDNETLGLPHEPKDSGVTQSDLINCMRMDLGVHVDSWPSGPISLGVDWGDVSWVQARGRWLDPKDNTWKPRVLAVFKIDSKNGLDHAPAVARIFESYGCNGVIVADAGYGKDRNEWLEKKFPGKVYSCWYPVMEKTSKIFKAQWQHDSMKVSVDRTASLKLTLQQFKDREVVLPGDREAMDDFIVHHLALKIVIERDPETRELHEFFVSTGSRGDHLAHASNYSRIGYEMLHGEHYRPNPDMRKPYVQALPKEDVRGDGGWDDGSR